MIDPWKAAVCAEVDLAAEELVSLSQAIHADPETAFQERRAAAKLTDALEIAGFRVERGVGGLPTAFLATLLLGDDAGTGHLPTVGICAEYDALPGLGHGCGHNVIAAAAVGAGVALARQKRQLAGRIVVVGTPAEEGGGGKVLLLDRGVFRGIDAAMMIHPATRNLVDRGSLASIRAEISFEGVSVHADVPPGIGINPLDAVLQTFNAVNGLRSRLRPDARIHGIVAEGGLFAAIVPALANARFSVRAADQKYAGSLVDMLRNCAEAAANTTGAALRFQEWAGYENMVPNQQLALAFKANLEQLGRKVQPTTGNERMGSTDMGNVSQTIPAIHAYIAIADEGVSGHSIAFREAACSLRANQGVLDGAKALAMTALDLLGDRNVLAAAQSEFADRRAAGAVHGAD